MGRVDGIGRNAVRWSVAGLAGFCLLPWYWQQVGLIDLGWIAGLFGSGEAGSGAAHWLSGGRWYLAPPGLALVAAAVAGHVRLSPASEATTFMAAGFGGLFWLVVEAFAIGLEGWSWPGLESLFGAVDRQFGMGIGAGIVALALLMIGTCGLAGRGAFRGDAFVAGAVGLCVATVLLFTLWPLLSMLRYALLDRDGNIAMPLFVGRLFAEKLWGIGCIGGGVRCGVAWNTLVLAVSIGLGTTILGLAFALIAVRIGLRFKGALRLLGILPIITPPFVIGLGLILILGRNGIVNQLLDWVFAIPPTRWIYGFQGVFLAQLFAFTPIAFLILVGVVQGVSPSVEEAAQTLRADRSRTFWTISLPLMRPGLVNAFLVGFVESIADFGNPILLGGNFGVLSTEIYFSVVGSQVDPGRAAAQSMILLGFAFAAFALQRRLTAGRAFTSVTGKGDAGLPIALPDSVRRLCLGLALPWALFTAVIYVMALAAGFVETWGRNYTPTLRHYAKAFAMDWSDHGLVWSGAAWDSFWNTLLLAAVAAPLTAALGLLTAWLLDRQRFAGREAFEFLTMLSFAVPGTVMGVSYVLAFNVPPLEIAGTGMIIVMCNVFRNMPVGVRAGLAAMSQIDRSLDEAALTLRGSAASTLRRVVMPLLKPALVAALVYSFVRAITTLSAVVFLVSAQWEMATTWIVLRVINGDYGTAIAYSSVLILLMVLAILLIQALVGERRLGRRKGGVRLEPPMGVATR